MVAPPVLSTAAHTGLFRGTHFYIIAAFAISSPSGALRVTDAGWLLFLGLFFPREFHRVVPCMEGTGKFP